MSFFFLLGVINSLRLQMSSGCVFIDFGCLDAHKLSFGVRSGLSEVEEGKLVGPKEVCKKDSQDFCSDKSIKINKAPRRL